MLKQNGKVKIAVLVSGGGTNLEQLLLAEQEGRLPHGEIVLVASSKPGVFALERAARRNVPTLALDAAALGQQAFEQQLTQALQQSGVQLIVLAGFLRILSSEFIRSYRERIINVHPSLIPAFCGDGFYGLRVHQAALEKGVKVSGATVHIVNEITDGGRILLQKAVDVLEGDTAESLQQRIMEQAEWQLLPLATEQMCRAILAEQTE